MESSSKFAGATRRATVRDGILSGPEAARNRLRSGPEPAGSRRSCGWSSSTGSTCS